MKQIQLNKGYVALVDPELFEELNKLTWFISDTGYVVHTLWENGGTRRIRLHRLITEAKEGEFVDHINGNKLDNRRCNLRLCSNAQNMRNREAPAHNTSGFKGVYLNKKDGKWKASIKVFYKDIHLGVYGDKREAAKAYNKAALEHFGEFALINKI